MFIDPYIGQQYVLHQNAANHTTKKTTITGPSKHPEGKWWNGSYTNTNQKKQDLN